MIDFSQGREQQVILDYFQDRIGTYLDIGANDGITFSNTRALYVLGWLGFCVEPSPAAYAKFEAENPPDGPTLINAAITTQDGPIDLYDSGTHLKKGDVALLSTTVPSEMARWARSGEQFTKTTVRGITFATLLKECGRDKFDFVSIDAEGMDYSILTQMNLTELGVQMLCIEFNQKNEKQFVDYCAKFGMRLHRKTYENLIFVRI